MILQTPAWLHGEVPSGGLRRFPCRWHPQGGRDSGRPLLSEGLAGPGCSQAGWRRAPGGLLMRAPDLCWSPAGPGPAHRPRSRGHELTASSRAARVRHRPPGHARGWNALRTAGPRVHGPARGRALGPGARPPGRLRFPEPSLPGGSTSAWKCAPHWLGSGLPVSADWFLALLVPVCPESARTPCGLSRPLADLEPSPRRTYSNSPRGARDLLLGGRARPIPLTHVDAVTKEGQTLTHLH